MHTFTRTHDDDADDGDVDDENWEAFVVKEIEK